MVTPSRPCPPVDEHINRMLPYRPGKPIEEVKRELGLTDVIKLASNENAIGPSPRAQEAVRDAATRMHVYPEGSCHDLRLAVAEHLGVPAECLVFGNGSDNLIHCLGLAFLMPGDEIVHGDTTFSQYRTAAMLNRSDVVVAPMRDWTNDVDALLGAVTPRTKMIFLANPNNPTGTIVKKADMRRLMDGVPDRVLVVFDEAYKEYVESSDYPETVDYVREGRNAIVLRTFSKAYGLAGIRVGYGITRPEIAEAIDRVREPFNVNLLGQAAATAALDDIEHIRHSREVNHAGKVFLTSAFREMGLECAPSEANFLWFNVNRDSVEVFQRLLERGVIIRTGDIFGAPTWLRVTIGTQAENERFVTALKGVLGQ